MAVDPKGLTAVHPGARVHHFRIEGVGRVRRHSAGTCNLWQCFCKYRGEPLYAPPSAAIRSITPSAGGRHSGGPAAGGDNCAGVFGEAHAGGQKSGAAPVRGGDHGLRHHHLHRQNRCVALIWHQQRGRIATGHRCDLPGRPWKSLTVSTLEVLFALSICSQSLAAVWRRQPKRPLTACHEITPVVAGSCGQRAGTIVREAPVV